MALPRRIFHFALCFMGFSSLKIADGSNVIIDKYLGKAASEIASPLSDVSRDINDALKAVELLKQETRERHQGTLEKLGRAPAACLTDEVLDRAAGLRSWNFDSCVNATDDAKEASDLAVEAEKMTADLGRTAAALGNNILNCPTWHVLDTMKCYNKNIAQLRDLVVHFKNESLPVVTEGRQVLLQLKLDFHKCVGISNQAQISIEGHLSKNC